MSRNTGTFNFAANLEGLLKAPIDAKQLVGTYADLTTPGTWNTSGQVWLYNGAIVAVGSDPTPSNNGVYWLCNATGYTSASNWVKVGSGGGTITGATNGLSVSGQNIKLGGSSLCEHTVIDANGWNLDITGGSITNLRSSNINLYATVNNSFLRFNYGGGGGTTGLINCNMALLLGHQLGSDYAHLSITGGYTIFTDTCTTTPGIQYNADYSANFTPRSLVDAAYVTGKTSTSGIQTADNGLTKLGTNVVLGGSLTGDTDINTNTYELTLGSVGSGTLKLGQSGVAGTVYSGGSSYDGIVYSGVTNAWIMQTPTALVTKEFVDIQIVNAISGITGTITGGTNGLGRTGMNICLGGTLNNDTIINANTNTLCVNNGYLSTESGYQISGTTILRADPNDIDSIYIGDNANFNISGTDNIGIGSWTLKSTTTGSNNIAIGASALSAITTSNGNVAIGYNAGMNETGSNKLIIANNANTCLIHGDFSTSGLTFNADIRIGKTPTTGITTDGFLVWNSADKCVKQVDVGSIIASSITGATNGLCKVGQTVVLGGNALTGDTCICTLNHSLNIGCVNTVELSVNSTSVSAFHCANASNGSAMSISNSGLTLSNKTSSISCSVTLGTNALVYGGCYHSSYVNRTLVDKEYVDKEISGTSNVLNYRTISNTYYTGRYDDVIGVSGISTNQIYLYPTPVLGQRVSVVDICGNALADPITINGYGKLINNGSLSTINTDYGSVTFVYNGIFWSAIAFVN